MNPQLYAAQLLAVCGSAGLMAEAVAYAVAHGLDPLEVAKSGAHQQWKRHNAWKRMRELALRATVRGQE